MSFSPSHAGRHRVADHDVDPLFPDRWSSRALSAEALPRSEMMRLFEAARWAPSAGNGQPWRFAWASRDSERFPAFLEILAEGNRIWCVHAGALVLLVSRTTSERSGRPSRTHSLDAGLACENLLLQASRAGLVAHPMAGFDAERARESLAIPAGYHAEVMIALGRPGPVEDLPEALRERETPSHRKPLDEIVFEGGFAELPPAD